MGNTYPMNGGDDAYSYTKNSQIQKLGSDSVKEMIQEALIENLETESMGSTVAIADLGCSVGPNTFFTVQNLIQAVENKWSSNNLEFQVFFNDHSGNDFNTLFASLPADRQYHAAGVPGSFHGRLFPGNSITVAQSSFALHWLSKQPQGVANEGRIHYAGAPEDVVRAYLDQFEKDLGGFISARAAEIVRGGLVFVVMRGIPDQLSHSDHPAAAFPFNFFERSLMDLANEGVVDRAKIEEFNLPIYIPSVREISKVIEKNGCFSIRKMELTKVDGPVDAASLIMHMRAGFEGIFTTHFGPSVVDKMFAKISEKTQEMSHYLKSDYHNSIVCVVLKRK